MLTIRIISYAVRFPVGFRTLFVLLLDTIGYCAILASYGVTEFDNWRLKITLHVNPHTKRFSLDYLADF